MRRGRCCSAVLVMVLACAPKPGGDSDGGDSEGGGSSGASGSSATDGAAPDLPPEPVCGDGQLDPGEECDDGGGGCDGCTERCTSPVEPDVEWSVALAPIVEVFGVDVTQQGRAWVLGATAEGGHVLLRIEGAAVVGSVDLAALGVADVYAFHVNGAAVDEVEVGVLAAFAGEARALRLGVDGLVGEPVPVSSGPGRWPSLAVTSLGVTVSGDEGARTLSPAGATIASFAEGRKVDALGDRLVFTGAPVVLVDPDGGDRVETTCAGDFLTTAGTHVVESFLDTTDGAVVMRGCELATGETRGGVVASGGAGGLEAGPRAEVQDGAANGNPLGYWRLCPLGAGDVAGCLDAWESGFGGPGDPRVLELDACDVPEHARVGLDGGVLMVRRDRTTGALSLVRRATLPGTPPWV